MNRKKQFGIMETIINFSISHPEVMQSRLFLKIMKVFPEMISSKYDTFAKRKSANYDEILRISLMSISKEPIRILDLCAGTGAFSLIAHQVFPDADLLSIDQSKGMLEVARNKAERLGFSKIQFKQENATQLLEPDSTFDLIITSNAPIYLAEIERVLEPGGTLLIAFSFGGSAFTKSGDAIPRFFEKYGLQVVKTERVGDGYFIISSKVGAAG